MLPRRENRGRKKDTLTPGMNPSWGDERREEVGCSPLEAKGPAEKKALPEGLFPAGRSFASGRKTCPG